MVRRPHLPDKLARLRVAVRALLLLILLGLTAGCAIAIARNPVPRALVDKAEVVGLGQVRFWGDTLPRAYEAMVIERYAQLKRHRPHLVQKGARPLVNHLAISGGGDNGAFGAGLLVGWSAAGTRPEFEIVTGVSTGALTAPFAFLGPAYDAQLKEVYTTYRTEQLASTQILRALRGGEAVADNSKLARVIAKYVTPEMLEAIAREHARGRRLLIGTTNLDAQRPVIWDMGAIASSARKREALRLFRQVLLASSAIPGVFPPVHIKVSAGGKLYDEMHVDGGTTAQVFFLPTQLHLAQFDRRLRIRPRRRLYIIRNVKVTPEWQPVEPRLTKIAGRSLSTVMKNQAIGDIYRLYVLARRNGIAFNLAAPPPDFNKKSKEPFDPEYMSALFDVGYRLAKAGFPWAHAPPGLVASNSN